MPGRRLPTNIPSNIQQAVALTIRKRVKTNTYSVYVPGTGQLEFATSLSEAILPNGLRTSGIWQQDTRRFVINETASLAAQNTDPVSLIEEDGHWSPEA